MSKMTMSDLMDYAVGVLIAGSKSDMPALTLNGALVSNGHRRRGIATALLNFLRQNNKSKILHPENKDAEISAWAQSVDTDLENYTKTPTVFEDIYGTANQDRHAANVRVKAVDTEQKKISDDVLDAEALHYAGQTYGELFHPNLQDYTSEYGGGLGTYKSTVGYVSARLLSSIRGNDPKDEGSVARKVENIQNGNGFDQPVSVVYNPRTGEAYVADGNHRVQASLEAGVSHVPTRVFIVDEPPARKTATPRKIERSGGLPFPDGALEVHPYFVFDRKDLVNQDSPEIVEEMLTNLALWSSRVEGTPGVQRSYLPDPGNIYEQLAAGEFVVDKSTGKIYKVYGLDIEKVVNADGQLVSRKTGKIVVRSLEGILDQMDVIRDSTEFNAAGIRYARLGMSNADRNYNDIRLYTDEIRDPQDFENVTDSFMKLSDQPILIDDTMFVVQRETGLKGRISGFVSEGVVRVDVLKGYDEDDDPVYEQVEMPVSEILPIQNQREVGPDEEPKNHSDDMKITLAQRDAINVLSSKLLKWGYISDEYYKAVQMSLNAGFITRSGAEKLYQELYNRNVLRVSKIRGTDVKAEPTAAPERAQAQGEAPAPAPSAPTPSVEPGDEADIAPGKMSFEELLKLKLERSKRDDVTGVEEFSLPVTDSKVIKNQPTPSQILEVERRLTEPGVVSEERAAQILEALPLLNAAALDGILDELRTATLNKRIANDQDVSDVSIPEDYNRSKLSGYIPRKTRDNQPIVEESSSPEEVIQDSEDGGAGEGIELSGEQKAVADHVLHATEGVIFLTGKAGAGKSTLVREIERLSKKRGQGVVIAAPTGVAALNAGGKTLHATFGFPVELLGNIDMAALVAEMRKSPTGRGKLGILKSMDLLIVDEISMVNADMIDAMDRMLRLVRGEMSKPFGGAKILMVGDPAQLSPVPYDPDKGSEAIAAQYMKENYLSDWFFDADVWAANPFEKFTLTEVFRQSDPEFIDALNATREGSVTQEVVDYFNNLSRKNDETEQAKDAPRMVPTNGQADEINARELEALEGTPVTFTGEFKGPNAEAFFSKLSGPLPAKDSVFKVGEPVMFVKNDDSDQRAKAGVKDKKQRWVNGTVGKIIGFKRTDDGGKAIIVEVDGVKHTVTTATWEKIGYSLDLRVVDEKTQRETILTDVEATYEQIPLKPAWAITIHKSQGKTYDAAIIDYTRKAVDGGRDRGGAFAAGQTYVALSRLRSPEGLKLEVPLKLSDFRVDRRVQQFLSGKPDTPLAVSESAITKDFDPLKGFETSAELENAIMNNKITGPNGETLTVYQRNALMTYLKKIQENPNSADRIRSKMSALLESWFGVGNPEEMSTRKRPVDIDMSSFRDPAEKQALLDLLAANGIPYNLKYDSEK
jgi:energy-coupling factor transporter ATP-binding protein EcfA2